MLGNPREGKEKSALQARLELQQSESRRAQESQTKERLRKIGHAKQLISHRFQIASDLFKKKLIETVEFRHEEEKKKLHQQR